MNNLIEKIKTKFIENRKNMLWIAFFIMLFWSNNSFAVDNGTAQKTTEFFNTIIAIGNTAFAIGAVIIGVLTQFIGLFLQPEWMTGSIIGLDSHLKSLWVLVSNIVYFIFAFLIIIIAFMNIIGKGDNNYQLKTALPHFIVGILIVPFSWFIIQFVLSISSILTVSALSLPYDLFGKGTGNLFDKTEVSTNCSIDMDKMMNGLTQSGTNDTKAVGIDCTGDKKSLSTLMSDGSSLFSIMYVYTYGIMKIQDLDKLTSNQLPNTSSIGTVAANLIFNGIFVIAFLILLIALGIAMFSRGVVLWLFTIFSPLFGLLYFFNGKAPKALEKVSFKDFLGVAMVPVYVGLALSFGLVFTFVATQGLTNNASISGSNSKLEGNTISVGGMNLTITGAALGSYKNAASSVENKNVGQAIASGSADFLAQLIVDLIALAVLWMAVMAALKSSTITANVVQPIAQFGESIGKTAMKMPQYAPIFPGGQSAASLSTVGSNISSSFESAQNRKGTEFYSKHFGEGDKLGQTAREVKTKLDILPPKGLREEQLKILKETGGDLNKLLNNSDRLSTTKEIAKRLKVDEKYYKEINSPEQLAKLIQQMEEVADKDITTGGGIFKNKGLNDLNGQNQVQDAIKKEIEIDKRGLNNINNGNTTININNINSGVTKATNGQITKIDNPEEFAKELKTQYGENAPSKVDLESKIKEVLGIHAKDNETQIKQTIIDFFEEKPKS